MTIPRTTASSEAIAYRLQKSSFAIQPPACDRNHRRIEALIKNGRLKTRDRTTPACGHSAHTLYGGAQHQVVTPDEQYVTRAACTELL